MFFEAKLLGALGLVAALVFAVKMHDSGIRRQCENDHKLAAAAELQRHTQAIGEIANEAQRMQARAVADRASLDSASKRLRGAIGGSGLILNPAATAASSPAESPPGMCTELLDKADRRLRILAKTADERGNAGSACEQYADTLKK